MPVPSKTLFVVIILYAIYSSLSLINLLHPSDDVTENHHSFGGNASQTPNKIVHVGKFGLGHRLSKLSAAYHLGSDLHLSVEVHWNDCQLNMFSYLFGSSTLVPYQETNATHYGQGKTILIRNDVHGYYAGQNYKNARVPVTNAARWRWQQKLEHDRFFFRQLVDNFAFDKEMKQYQTYHNWFDHYVYGLHVRLGNGEGDHFVQAERHVPVNHTVFLENIAQLISAHNKKRLAKDPKHSNPPLVFVATDTGSIMPVLVQKMQDLGLSVVAFDQERLQEGQGVSFQAWKDGNKCQTGWRDATIDMILMSQADSLLASSRSTFTQILPRSLMQMSSKEFCECNPDATGMDCISNEKAWLFRDDSSNVTKVRLKTSNGSEVPPFITHKVMVHLPDVDHVPRLNEVEKFLDNRSSLKESTFTYGPTFNTKYRKFGNFTTHWTY